MYRILFLITMLLIILLIQPLRAKDGVTSKLAEALYFEALSEPPKCQLMVANVVMNRVADSRWPDTVEGVINQPLQFSYMSDGKPETIANKTEYSRLYLMSSRVLSGILKDITDGANHYVNHNISSAKWHTGMEFKGRCGDHWFYKS